MVVLVCVFASGVLRGQTAGTRLEGRITAADGSPLKGAVVSIASGSAHPVVVNTDAHGGYRIVGLAAGDYKVVVTASGMQPGRVALTLNGAGRRRLNVTLQPVVAPANPAAEAAAAGVVGAETVRDLPLNGRSATDAATLEPGVSGSRAAASGASAQRGFGSQITISGGRPRQNDNRLDGVSVNDYANAPPGSAAGVNLGVDAVEQVQVLANNYPAQYGNSSGGIISSTTRAGSAEFHGSAFEFARNSALDTRNYFDLVKPAFSRNQFGGTLGGPLWRRRTFFFAAYEGFRQSLGVSQVTTVPTAAARAGQLSTGKVTVDPAVLSFVNAFYPLPNGPTLSSGDTGIFNFAGQQVTPEDYFDSRVDHKLGSRDQLIGTYMHDSATVRQPDEFNNKRTGYDSGRQVFSLNEVHSFSSDAVNSLRFGLSRVVATTGLSFSVGQAAASSTLFGTVPGQNAAMVAVPGLTAFSGGVGEQSNYHFHWTSLQGYDNFSWVRGRHLLKAGAEVERTRDNILGVSDPGGSFAFNSLGDLLANRPFSLSATIPGGVAERGYRQTIAAGYVEDRWAAIPRVTLSLGVRYEMATVPTEVHDKLTVLRNLTDAAPHLGAPLFANPTRKNVQPRVGLAWDVMGDGRTAVSAGFGIFDVLPLPYLFQFGELYSAPYYQFASSTSLTPGSFPGGAFADIAGSTAGLRAAYYEPKPPRSYVMQWNLSVQRQLASQTSATVSYAGSRSVHQPLRSEDANIVLPQLTPQGYEWPAPVGSGARLNPGVGRLTAMFWRSDAYYDALQAHLRTQIRRVGVQASYTWGKTIDTSSGSIVGDEYANSISSPLFFNPGINRGLADFNVAQNLEVNASWELPSPQRRGLARTALGGWQLGGVFEVSTGVPFTPTIGGDALGLNSTDPAIDVPNLVQTTGCRSLSNAGNPLHYIRTQCLAFPQPVTLRGNLGRNTAIGPGLIDLDGSLIKNTSIKRISSTFNVQFRAEFFNVMNHANFAAPLDNRNVFTPNGQPIANAGVITTTQTPAREVQLAIKAIW